MADGNIEWMFRSDWSVRMEYLYYNPGKVSYNDGNLIELFYCAAGILPGQPIFTNGVNTTIHCSRFERGSLMAFLSRED